jgi:hypothetical protein
MIYQPKSTEFGEFCTYFFENFNFGQILSENLTEKHRNSRISPISLRTGKKPKPKSKSLGGERHLGVAMAGRKRMEVKGALLGGWPWRGGGEWRSGSSGPFWIYLYLSRINGQRIKMRWGKRRLVRGVHRGHASHARAGGTRRSQPPAETEHFPFF